MAEADDKIDLRWQGGVESYPDSSGYIENPPAELEPRDCWNLNSTNHLEWS